MNVMQRRRELIAMPHGLDTSPVIDDYGHYWVRGIGAKAYNDAWCITKFYDVNDPVDGTNRMTYINGYVGKDSNTITFQYYISDGSDDWWYFAGINPRAVINSPRPVRLTKISFSIEIAKIKDTYAYIQETGQILFAGKNSIYYGHRNISELN